MIKKEKAKKLGIKIREQNDLMGKKNKELIKKLKSLLPNIINSDGTLNTEALQDAIDTSHRTSKKNQGYELTFVGKSEAGWIAGSPTKKELKTEKEESKNFETTRNVLIRGDNLDVLKILYQNYHNKIKMIYIDPPYNTKSDEFIYKDDFKKSEQELIEECGIEEEELDFLHNIYGTKTHSGWLAFMYPRLKLARDLLREDGVIFISIDDNEQANLKIMCDEIFGEDNFVGQWNWFKSGTPPNLSKKIKKNIEYILCYEKQHIQAKYKGLNKQSKSDDPLTKPQNSIKTLTFPIGAINTNKEFKAGTYGTEKYPNNILDNLFINNGKNKNSVRFKNRFIWTQEKLNEELKKGTVINLSNNGILSYKKRDYDPEVPPNFISSEIGNTNENAGIYIKDLMNGYKVFDYPKPIELIEYLTNFLCDNNDLILDFFAGSGTTGDAVMRLNAEDGGNRNFILVQWDEKINPKKNKEAHDFCKDNNLPPVISSICLERLNRAGEKIKRENQNKRGMFPSSEELDIGYKVFSLKDKPAIGKEDEIFKLKNERQSTLDTLFNMLSATGKSLDTPIQEIQKDILYECDNEIYLIGITDREVFENYRNHKLNIDGYSNISLEQQLNLNVANKENITVVY